MFSLLYFLFLYNRQPSQTIPYPSFSSLFSISAMVSVSAIHYYVYILYNHTLKISNFFFPVTNMAHRAKDPILLRFCSFNTYSLKQNIYIYMYRYTTPTKSICTGYIKIRFYKSLTSLAVSFHP